MTEFLLCTMFILFIVLAAYTASLLHELSILQRKVNLLECSNANLRELLFDAEEARHV